MIKLVGPSIQKFGRFGGNGPGNVPHSGPEHGGSKLCKIAKKRYGMRGRTGNSFSRSLRLIEGIEFKLSVTEI